METGASRVVRSDRETVVFLSGDFDMANSAELRAAFTPEIGAEGRLVADLSAVTFMDSSSLNVLLDVYQRQEDLGGSFAMQKPSPTALRLLEITGLDHLVRAG